jgi:hypothetical protein
MIQMPGFVLPVERTKKLQQLEESLTIGASRILTLCELLRFIYDSVAQIEDEEIKADLTSKLLIAMNMAKKMDKRLGYYRKQGLILAHVSGMGNQGTNLIKLLSTKRRRRLRIERYEKSHGIK